MEDRTIDLLRRAGKKVIVIGAVPEMKYDGSISVFTEKFEGNCTAYLKDDKVIYVESIFD